MYSSQFLHLRPNCQTPIQAWETLNPNMSHAALLLSLSLLKRWCTQMYHDSSWQKLTIQQSEWWLACDPWALMMVMAPPPPPSQLSWWLPSYTVLPSFSKTLLFQISDFSMPPQYHLFWWFWGSITTFMIPTGCLKIFLLWFYSNWNILSAGQFQMVDQNLWAIWIFLAQVSPFL